jgi:hypothetical protein
MSQAAQGSMRAHYEQLGPTAYYTMHGDTYRSPHDQHVQLVSKATGMLNISP